MRYGINLTETHDCVLNCVKCNTQQTVDAVSIFRFFDRMMAGSAHCGRDSQVKDCVGFSLRGRLGIEFYVSFQKWLLVVLEPRAGHKLLRVLDTPSLACVLFRASGS